MNEDPAIDFQRHGPRLQSILMAGLVLLIVAALLAVFFESPLRQRVEDKFFDLRTRLAPVSLSEPLPLIVKVDQISLKRLHMQDLDYETTALAVSKLLASGATSVTVLLHPQVYSYDDPMLALLTDLVNHDRRVFLAVFDITTENLGLRALPPLLQGVSDNIVAGAIKRDFKRSIVRDITLPDATSQMLPHVIGQMAHSLKAGVSAKSSQEMAPERQLPARFRMNYPAFAAIPQVSLIEALEPDPLPQALNRPVILGYGVYRPTRDNQSEATFINSPWQEEGHDVEEGVPLTDVIAAASINLAHGSHLDAASPLVPLLQISIVSALAFAAWSFSAGAAALIFVGGWALLIGLHSLFFGQCNLYIPLADTALFSSVAMIGGALLRIRTDGRLRAAQEARTQADAAVASVQERFLDVFASELTRINQDIHRLLLQHKVPADASPRAIDAHHRALQSCEELEDYLQGIENFARFRSHGRTRPKMIPVSLDHVVRQTLKQFESRQKESAITVTLDVNPLHVGLAEPTLVGQILYNLISNAIKYSPPQSTVAIRSYTKNATVFLQVTDQGPGIPSEHQKLIFEKFYRIQNDLSYKVKGHGLGLYLSQYFATLIDAEIKVESEVGAGSTFILCLRASSPEPQSK